jgi:lipopolysaccharide transport protein LptA
MTQLLSPRFRALVRAMSVTALVCTAGAAAHAEKADRTKPLNVVADREGNFDLLKQVIVFSGNVVITKGSIVIKADRVEVRERPDGYKIAMAFGSATHPATFRQKREGVDEFIDGQAERLEYDEKPDTIRFVNNATVRRLRGSSIGDEITGSVVTYDNTTEVFQRLGRCPVVGRRCQRLRWPRARRADAARRHTGSRGGRVSCRRGRTQIQPDARRQEVSVAAAAAPRSVGRLAAQGLQKTYGVRKVVKDVHLAVDAGEVVGLLGPNGAGKTTSFYMIVGLVRADAGQITIDGEAVERLPIHRRSRLGLSYLPQEASIFRKLSVEENIRAVLELQLEAQASRCGTA